MTRRALLIGVSGAGIDVSLAGKRLTPVLRELGFDKLTTCVDAQATRAGMLAALDRLIDASEPGDAVFVHYFGHGGRVRFSDLHPEQVFGYVTCTKLRGGGFEAVLDRELSHRFAELDARCGNVTVMLDCCFSAELVRSGGAAPAVDLSRSSERREPAPDWARDVLAAAPSSELALDSHPRIVRVCGASPKREAFAAVRSGRHIGRLTEAFIAATHEAGGRWSGLSWATLGHRLREHVVEALAMESQWVVVAGPRTRRLFATETVELPGTVTFTPGADGGWLRAGWHQGVAVGDRFGLLDPHVDDEGRATIVAEVVVIEVMRNRARVELRTEPTIELRPGTPAVVLAVHEPMPVECDDPALREAIERSAWLCLSIGAASLGLKVRLAGAISARAKVRSEPEALVIEAPSAAPVRMPADAREQVIALLDDRGRLHAWQRALARGEPSPCPLRWRWSVIDHPQPLPESGASVRAGERIRVDIECPAGGPPINWFVAVVLIDPAGHLRLLSTRMPEGIELAPGDAEVIGVRAGRRGAQGFELRWPPEVDADEAPASLLLLASRRPIELGHLVDTQADDDDAALALQGLDRDTLREQKPEHTRGCAWAQFDFHLRRC
jgi:hypothetical protein